MAFVLGFPMLASGERKQVLVINSENAMLPVVDRVNRSLFEAIKEELGRDTEIFVEWLDLNRFGKVTHFDDVARLIERKYSAQGIDGIVAVSESALIFSASYRDRIFPGVPLVHLGVKAAEVSKWNAVPGIHGAAADYDPGTLLAFIRKVHPEVKTVVVITGSSPMERGWKEVIEMSPARSGSGFSFEFWNEWTMAGILSRLPKLGRESVVITPGILSDGAGEWMVGSESMIQFVASSPRPVYSLFPERGAEVGTVGGIGPDFSAMGPQAARILSRVLSGEPPEPGNALAPVRGYFHWGELKRWGIPENSLSAGSVIMQRVPGFWEMYGHWVLAGVGIIALQSGFIAALLVQKRRRMLAERELATRRREITHLTRVSMLGELSGTLSHEFSQPLATIMTSVQAAENYANRGGTTPEVRELLGTISRAGKRASGLLDRLRGMIRRDEPRVIRFDLNDSIREILVLMRGEFSARQVQVDAGLSEDSLIIDGDPVQIQQIAVNLLTNACEAMTALVPSERRVEIRTGPDPRGKKVELRVSDCGSGFSGGDPEQMFDSFYTTKSTGLGLGMSICRQIATDHGGTISASRREGPGITVVLRIPTAALPTT